MERVETLGFIGMGVMGEGMCGNVVRKSGKTVYGFDLNPEPLDRLKAEGLVPMASPREVAAQADVILLSLPSGKQVEEVCRGPEGLFAQPGRVHTVVDMSTSPAQMARELAVEAKAHGITFIDAPVARLRQAARDGTLSIMVGGEQATFEAVHPILSCMGTDITLCGPVGSGQVVKALNNMIVFMNIHALAEALAIGRANGVDPEQLFHVMSLGSADSFALRTAGMKSLVPDDFPEKAFPTEYALKDIRLALDLARDKGVAAEQAQRTHDMLVRTRDAGYGQNYYPALIRVIEGRTE